MSNEINFLAIEVLGTAPKFRKRKKNASLCIKALHKELDKEFSCRGRVGRERKWGHFTFLWNCPPTPPLWYTYDKKGTCLKRYEYPLQVKRCVRYEGVWSEGEITWLHLPLIGTPWNLIGWKQNEREISVMGISSFIGQEKCKYLIYPGFLVICWQTSHVPTTFHSSTQLIKRWIVISSW